MKARPDRVRENPGPEFPLGNSPKLPLSGESDPPQQPQSGSSKSKSITHEAHAQSVGRDDRLRSSAVGFSIWIAISAELISIWNGSLPLGGKSL
jgi:hypothetical protein